MGWGARRKIFPVSLCLVQGRKDPAGGRPTGERAFCRRSTRACSFGAAAIRCSISPIPAGSTTSFSAIRSTGWRANLKIEAQEFLDVGRLRVNVKDDKGYVGDAYVKVIGSGDQRFRSGNTDLRGIFVAENLVGQATVIVKKGDQYAFFRGKGINQPPRYRPPAQTRRPAGKPKAPRRQGQDFKAWGNNFLYNDQNRTKQIQWLQREVMNKQQKGVEGYRTK